MATKLEKWRVTNSLDRNQLAELAATSYQTIWRIETGEDNISPDLYIRIAAVTAERKFKGKVSEVDMFADWLKLYKARQKKAAKA